MSVNKVILIGNAGKDPEVRYLDNGATVANFSLATSETYNNKNGERITNTEWHNIVMWRGLAQVAEKYIKKGSQLYIEGKIRSRSYDDKDGNKRFITEIVADNLTLLGRPKSEDRPEGQGQRTPQQNNTSTPQPDDGYRMDAGSPGQSNDVQAGGDPFQGEETEDDLPF